MKHTVLAVVLLLTGIGAGYLFGSTDLAPGRSTNRSDTTEVQVLRRQKASDDERIADLLAEIQRLQKLLQSQPHGGEAVPYTDSIDDIERLLQDAYAENNVDWLLEVIERLLRLGERGYPILRRLLEDIIFKAKFLPAQSDFEMAHLYKFGRIFANLEKEFIGFINYLLNEPRSHPWFKQGAMMAGAFYVGSAAPGTEELKQTMMELFLAESGMTPAGMLPGNIGKKMNVFAMAMSGDKRMIKPLRDELNATKDEDLKGDIIGALAHLGDPEAVPLIQARLNPEKGDFRRELRALGRVGSPEAHTTARGFIRSITDGKRFYRHAGSYIRNGGGSAGVLLIKDRVQANPDDKSVNSAIGTLRNYPTAESLDTLNTIAQNSGDKDIRERAVKAAEDVGRRLRGEIPDLPPK